MYRTALFCAQPVKVLCLLSYKTFCLGQHIALFIREASKSSLPAFLQIFCLGQLHCLSAKLVKVLCLLSYKSFAWGNILHCLSAKLVKVLCLLSYKSFAWGNILHCLSAKLVKVLCLLSYKTFCLGQHIALFSRKASKSSLPAFLQDFLLEATYCTVYPRS